MLGIFIGFQEKIQKDGVGYLQTFLGHFLNGLLRTKLFEVNFFTASEFDGWNFEAHYQD